MSDDPSGDPEITVLGMEDEDDRSLWWRPDEVRYGREVVSARALAERVEEFVDSMRTVLARLPEAVGQYEVDQITVAAEVSAKGKVSLLGSGGELAGKGGLTFTFKKRQAPPIGGVRAS
jgi:hypothetical protein